MSDAPVADVPPPGAAPPDGSPAEVAPPGVTAGVVPAPVTITREQVAHLARLSRLALSDDELDGLAAQLDVVLQAVAQIGEVTDTADVPPTTHAVPVENVTRPDVVLASLPRAAVLAMAPEAEDGRFRVPRILDEPS